MLNDKKRLGAEGENAACAFLSDQGVRILERNFRCRFGEIDIIAIEQNCRIMIEVKTRKDEDQGFPGEAVDRRKQYKICRVFDYYRMKYQLSDEISVRFDVIEVDKEMECHWIKNAFEYQNRY